MTQQRRTSRDLSHEALVRVLEERLDNHARIEDERYLRTEKTLSDGLHSIKVEMSEQTAAMKALESREAERNGQVRALMQYKAENEQHWAEHMIWAAERASALENLEEQHHDADVRSGVWQSQYRWLMGGIAGGIAIAGAVERLIAWGGFF